MVERGDSSTHQGMVRIIENGQPLAEPFLTVDNVGLENERGLMSLAFAPDYATSGLFYVFYVVNESGDAFGGDGGDIRIVEYQVSAGDPDKADPASARLVFSTPHYTTYHQGSWMAFGPDGHLYFTIGDDGYGPNAQLKDNYFGKIMRIDPADPDGNGPASHTV
ncbi:MAG TPA: PQQ-dependent sugar dehydrogenase, partial [Solirubrobacterales bacterium]|nr:PQQ-dependent sugar dehydrogenase [Solirubrobacterales bacterium]